MKKKVPLDPVSRIEFSREDVRRLNWYGIKPVLARVLEVPGVNPVVRGLARAILPAAVAQRLPVNKATVAYRLDDGSTVILLDVRRDAVAKDIWLGGGKPTQHSEVHKLSMFESLAKSSNTCLDIGAYAGFFALVAARANPQLRAIAFEIVPENYLLAMRNIIANNLVERVECRLRGLAAEAGSMTIPQGFSTPSLMSSISIGSHFEDGVSIPLVRLDDELPQVARPVLIKIDVEGFETDIFAGGLGFIKDHLPDIVCEILPGASGSCAYIAQNLEPLGYTFYCFEDHGLEPAKLNTRPVMRDWLFSAKSRLPSLPRSPLPAPNGAR